MREILFRGKDKFGIPHCGNLHIDILTSREDKYYISPRIGINCPSYIEVTKESVGQITDSKDIDGNDIYENDLVNQKSVLIGDDENVDFTGYVEFLEGSWVINNGEDAIPLWSEHRENKILRDY
jgi:hypothetical protein